MGERFCPNITKCPMYAFLERQDFRDCMNTYCLGNHLNCERWRLRSNGQHVPEDLLPDGQAKVHVLSTRSDDDGKRVSTVI